MLASVGILMALPFFLWVPLGWLELVPPMVDVFGVVGLRIPASLTIAGLLIAAIAFWEV
jgi:hypothetical protein